MYFPFEAGHKLDSWVQKNLIDYQETIQSLHIEGRTVVRVI